MIVIRLQKSYQTILLRFCCCLLAISTGASKTYGVAKPFTRMAYTFSKRYHALPYARHTYRSYVLSISAAKRSRFNHRLRHLLHHHRGHRDGRVTWPYILCAGIVLAQKRTIHPTQAEDNQYSVPRNLHEMNFSPSDYEFAFLSNHVDKPEQDLQKEKENNTSQKKRTQVPVLEQKVNGKKETLAGWAIQDIFTDSAYPGCQSVLYIHHEKKQLVLAYQGTNKLEGWPGTNSPAILDHKATQALQAVIDNALRQSIALAKTCDYTLALTGHAVGGWLAQIASFRAHEAHLHQMKDAKRMLKTVVFDAPGAQAILDQLQQRSPSLKLDHLDITNYVATPNNRNTSYKHKYATLYQVMVDKKFSAIPVQYDEQSHCTAHFLSLFDKERGGFAPTAVGNVHKIAHSPAPKPPWGLQWLTWGLEKIFDRQFIRRYAPTLYNRYASSQTIEDIDDPIHKIHKRHIPSYDYDFLCGKKDKKERFVNALATTKWAKHLAIDKKNKDYVTLTEPAIDIRIALDELHSLTIRYPDIVRQEKRSRSAIDRKKHNFSMGPMAKDLFIGRTKARNTLAPYFDKKDNFVIFPPITGDRGLGKTQLVHKLITQHASKYDHIVWINATSSEDIEASYRQIGKELSLQLADKSPAQVITQVEDWLKEKHVLYVFDNVPNLQAVQPYLKNGHILITSRHNDPREWLSSHYDAPISLTPFSKEEALHLAKSMGYNRTDPSLMELIQLLPCEPLIMVQILNHMRASHDTPQTFLHKIKQDSALIEQLKANPQDHTTHEKLRSYLLKSTLEALASTADGEALVHLIQQMACLGAQPIPLSFVLLVLGEKEAQTRDLLLTLHRHGLVHWAVDHVHMHPATQATIRDLKQLTPAQIANLVDRYVAYGIDEVARKSYPTANFWHHIRPHGEALLAYVEQQRGEDISTARCYRKLGYLYGQQGNDEKALQLGKKALRLFEKVYGDQPHPETTAAYHDISSAYNRKREYRQALRFEKKALNMHQALYGDQAHPALIMSYHNIGTIHHNIGDYDLALVYHKKALDMRKEVYGDRPHPEIAAYYNHIGSVYYHQGRYTEAIEYHKKALDMSKKVYRNPHHENIATYYNNIGTDYYSQENYGQALQFYHKALEMRKKVYGDQPHPEIATSYHNIGASYYRKKTYDPALQFHQMALEAGKKVYGDQPHPKVALSHSSIGTVYYSTGDYHAALQHHKAALEMRLTVYGDQPHPEIAMSYHNIGFAYYGQKEYDQALQYYQTALDIRKKLYPDQPHPEIAMSYNNIGFAYYRKKEYDQALQFYQMAIDMSKKVYDDQPHPYIAKYYDNMAAVYDSKGDYAQANALHDKASSYR